MTSRWSKPYIGNMRVGCLRGILLSLYFVLLSWSQAGFATEVSEIPAVPANGAEAWLVTFGPGEIYWERFGHNAIWLREPAVGLDHTFNFGYFDFEQENFLLNFARGRMLYFSVAQSASREFDFYRQENRSIRLQKLNLSSSQYQQLRDHLVNEIKPENRNYRYDYYLNNCSTRIRDALDIALDGALSARTEAIPANLNFRDQTRRLTQMQFWFYLGLELSLGSPVDRAVTRWDEMFIPMVVADEIAEMSLAHDEVMAWVLGLSHLVNIAFAGALAQSGEKVPLLKKISSSTFNAQLNVATQVVSENPHLYFEIQQGNVNTGEVNKQFQKVLDELVTAVGKQDETVFTHHMHAARERLAIVENKTEIG